MRVSHLLVMLCAATTVGVTTVASAEENEQGSVDIESAMKSGEIVPLEEIIQRAKSQFPGKVTEIELGYSEGRYVYEVDVMDDNGVKRELKLDARTAELLSSEIDDDDENEAAATEGECKDEVAQADPDDEEEEDDEDE